MALFISWTTRSLITTRTATGSQCQLVKAHQARQSVQLRERRADQEATA